MSRIAVRMVLFGIQVFIVHDLSHRAGQTLGLSIVAVSLVLVASLGLMMTAWLDSEERRQQR